MVNRTTDQAVYFWATVMEAQTAAYCQGAEAVRCEPMTREERAELYETDHHENRKTMEKETAVGREHEAGTGKANAKAKASQRKY